METLKQNLLQNGMAIALIMLGGAAFILRMPDTYVSLLIGGGLAAAKNVHPS